MSRLSLVITGAILAVSAPLAVAQVTGAPWTRVDPATLGPIPDSPASGCGMPGRPRDVRIQAYGQSRIATVSLHVSLRHPAAGQLSVTLIAPDGTSHPLFGRPGAHTSSECGSAAALDGAYEFVDDGGDFWAAAAMPGGVVPTGRFAPSTVGGGAGGGLPTRFSTVLVGTPSG